MSDHPTGPRGRGAAVNPATRFSGVELVPEEAPPERVETLVLADASRTIISRNTSPDIPFDASVNPYRGCEHGCAYCYARTFHEYLDLSAGLDFETRILVKHEAAELLRAELAAPRYRPTELSLSGVTDPYQPLERRLGITRQVLEVLAEHRHPVTIVTKNALVVRDADLLAELARFEAARVHLSVTTLDAGLARRLEPRTSQPGARLEAIRRLTAAGIPVGVLAAPMIPGLTDHELPAILAAAAEAGARWSRMLVLRLPGAVATIFRDWLERHEPNRVGKVLGRVRAMRGGALNDSRFGRRMRGSGPFADQLEALHRVTARRLGLDHAPPPLATHHFRRPGGVQLDLW